jgi:hypothetical protein
MDPWDIVTNADCRHESHIEVQPGRTQDDPVDAYCAICGEKVDLPLTWRWFVIEADFEEWARENAARRRT